MTSVTLTYGLPASGKSTWAKEMVANSDGQVVRVNMDDIRAMIGLPYSKHAENLALDIQDKSILAAVKAGKDVIVDNTHIEKKMPTRIKRLFDGEVEFRVADFTHVSSMVCIDRDGHREKSVGADVIRRMAGRLSKGSWKLTPEWMNDVVLSPAYVPADDARPAIIVDIDGTLAKHIARSPYDYSRVLTDEVIVPIRDMVLMYEELGYNILITSGRPDIDNVRADTEKWLYKNGLVFDGLFMRPADMLTENDADVKQYLFDTYIRSSFRVDIVLDDRDRVVRRWRKLGLTVAQPAYGDF